MIARRWGLDLRAVGDQPDEELRQSLPQFLWSAQLRDAYPNAAFAFKT